MKFSFFLKNYRKYQKKMSKKIFFFCPEKKSLFFNNIFCYHNQSTKNYGWKNNEKLATFALKNLFFFRKKIFCDLFK